jgi:hypothetical protein
MTSSAGRAEAVRNGGAPCAKAALIIAGPVNTLRQTAQFSTLSPGIAPSSKARSFVTNVAPVSMVAQPYRPPLVLRARSG